MNPVLIFTDTERIAEEKAALNSYVTGFQSIYDQIKALGITPTIQKVSNLLQWRKQIRTDDYVGTFVLNELLALAGNYSFNGITLNQEKLKELIVIPDLTTLKSAINTAANVFAYNLSPNTALLTVNNDVISKVANSDTQIETLYTYYTKTDASAQLATDLTAVCDSLNSFDESNGGFLSSSLMKRSYSSGQGDIDDVIPGVSIINSAFVISLKFIRRFEEDGTLYFASR
ncbi:MAG TPA: hypothetical protein VL442_22925 [Mucilaginibacter sp.]|jgi:hypothetical protein|nr:hypothetical protein [Mucilaginibacter sp.]